jgi:hypothetical protein
VGCEEFLITKSDDEFLTKELDHLKSTDNIFISISPDMWKLQLRNNHKIQYISPYLAIYKDNDRTIYFSAFPEQERSNSLATYQFFFQNLFDYLKSRNELHKIKSITFFDAGWSHDYLSLLAIRDNNDSNYYLHRYIKNTFKWIEQTDKDYKFWQKLYELSFAMQNLAPTERFYSKDSTSSCGRKMVILKLTPNFIRNKILKIPSQQ